MKLDNSLASKIIKAMLDLDMTVSINNGELNIVYLEGCEADGRLNDDRPDTWNDRRLLIRFENDEPKILLNAVATSEPGRYYTVNPMNANGCARIALNSQYKAWQVGLHNGRYEALVQTGGEVEVCRDLNKDFKRTGDKVYKGYFGINQHHGHGSPTIGKGSAGCLVGQSVWTHQKFMGLVKLDPRYKANRAYVFWTAVLDAGILPRKVV